MRIQSALTHLVPAKLDKTVKIIVKNWKSNNHIKTRRKLTISMVVSYNETISEGKRSTKY